MEQSDQAIVVLWKSWAGWQYADNGRINGIRDMWIEINSQKEVFLGDNSTIPPVDPPDDGGGNEPTPEKTKRLLLSGEILYQNLL